MKLPSYLVKSRHGVFYFRLTVRNESGVHEKRFSLGTREPHQAKLKALYISAELKGSRVSTNYDPKKLNLDDLSTYSSAVLPDWKRRSRNKARVQPVSKLK